MRAPIVVRSAEAQRDFRRLYAWIARDGGKARARVVLGRLDRAMERLALRSRLGRLRQDFEGVPRSFSVRPWLIVYDPLPDSAGIHVLRILDSRQDIAALMGKKS